MKFHRTEQSYNIAYKLKSVIPAYSLYYITRVIGTKKLSATVAELKDAVDQCFWVKEELGFYTKQQWIFESKLTAIF